jgi:hypothetical protein
VVAGATVLTPSALAPLSKSLPAGDYCLEVHMARLVFAVACLAVLSPAGSGAQVPAGGGAQGPARADVPVLLARLEGDWAGEGTILGQPATVEMHWTPALAGAFLRLTWVSHIGAAPKAARFEGQAYYRRTGAGVTRATWFDSSGQVRPIVVSSTGDALVAAWGTPETEVGETTYRLESATRVLVVDRVRQKDGTWREFGRSILSRTLPPA